MDLVNEQDVALFKVGELRRQIACFGDHRTGSRAEVDSQLARQNLRQRGFAKAGRADEQHMVERIAARFGRFNEHAQIFARGFLTCEIVERQRADGGVGIILAFVGRDEAGGRKGHDGTIMLENAIFLLAASRSRRWLKTRRAKSQCRWRIPQAIGGLGPEAWRRSPKAQSSPEPETG